MTHNVGSGGMLLASPAGFAVGERVQVTFVIPPSEGQHTFEATVLRVEPNDADPEGTWPHVIALAFETPDESLEPLLAASIERISTLP